MSFLSNFLTVERFKVLDNGYKLDRRLFQYGLLATVLFLSFIVYSENLWTIESRLVVSCPNDTELYCINPFYNEPIYNELGFQLNQNNIPENIKKLCTYNWCKEKYLEPGFKFGKEPGILYKNAWLVIISIFFIIIIVNHTQYNSHKKIKEWIE